MNLTIELSDELGRALQEQAQAQGVSANHYISHVLKNALTARIQLDKSHQPFETGYGTWAKYGSAPSAEEIDENRREMFQNFAKD